MNAAFSFAVRIGSMKQPIDNEAHPEADLLPGKKSTSHFRQTGFCDGFNVGCDHGLFRFWDSCLQSGNKTLILENAG
jgi:hypothetical protein